MASDSVFLNGEEASSLQEAVERIVSSGIRVQEAEIQIPPSGNEGDENGRVGERKGSSKDLLPPQD